MGTILFKFILVSTMVVSGKPAMQIYLNCSQILRIVPLNYQGVHGSTVLYAPGYDIKVREKPKKIVRMCNSE